MAVLGLDKARKAEVSKKSTIIVGSVLMAMMLFWAVMNPPQFVWKEGLLVGGVIAAIFLFWMSVGFFVCLGIVGFLLEGFPMEPFLIIVLVLWYVLYMACLAYLTADFLSVGVASLVVSFVLILFLAFNRMESEVQPLQEDATPSPV